MASKGELEAVLAARIRQLVSDRDIPLTHVADRAPVSRSHFWRILDAEVSVTLETVLGLGVALLQSGKTHAKGVQMLRTVQGTDGAPDVARAYIAVGTGQ